MNENEHMKKLAELLKEYDLKEFNESPSDAATFYFKSLQKIEVELLLSEFQIAEEEKQISLIEEKIQVIREENKSKNCNDKVTDIDCRGSRENRPQEDKKQYQCKAKNCQKLFQKDWDLELHNKLMHKSPLIRWDENQVFLFEITTEKQESQN